MNFDQFPSSQENLKITREEVIESIKNNPEDREKLGQFVDQLQGEVVEGKFDETEMSRQIADLYYELAKTVGGEWQEFAIEALEDLRMIANQFGNENLLAEANAKLDELEK